VTEALAHAVAQHHAACGVGGFHQIVGCAGRKVVEKDAFGGAAAERHGHPVFQLLLGHQEAIFGRALNGVAERPDAARNDRDLVDRVLLGAAPWRRLRGVTSIVRALNPAGARL
jgi:hypothetical protein